MANTFANILASTFNKDMGRKDAQSCGSLPGLGTSTIMASFIETGRASSVPRLEKSVNFGAKSSVKFV